MKKIFSLMIILMFGFSSFSNVSSSSYFRQEPTKMTKSGQPDKRYNANKHLKKDGTSDMRYNTSKKAAAKKAPAKKAGSPAMKKAA